MQGRGPGNHAVGGGEGQGESMDSGRQTPGRGRAGNAQSRSGKLRCQCSGEKCLHQNDFVLGRKIKQEPQTFPSPTVGIGRSTVNSIETLFREKQACNMFLSGSSNKSDPSPALWQVSWPRHGAAQPDVLQPGRRPPCPARSLATGRQDVVSKGPAPSSRGLIICVSPFALSSSGGLLRLEMRGDCAGNKGASDVPPGKGEFFPVVPGRAVCSASGSPGGRPPNCRRASETITLSARAYEDRA